MHDFIGTFDDGGYVHAVLVDDCLEEAAVDGLQGVHRIPNALTRYVDDRTAELARRADYRRGLSLVLHGGIGRGFFVGFGKPPPNWHRLALSVHDFMLLGWEHEMSALRAWKLLDQQKFLQARGITFSNLSGFMNLYGYAEAQRFELAPAGNDTRICWTLAGFFGTAAP
jgi:hypothetical protein